MIRDTLHPILELKAAYATVVCGRGHGHLRGRGLGLGLGLGLDLGPGPDRVPALDGDRVLGGHAHLLDSSGVCGCLGGNRLGRSSYHQSLLLEGKSG
ncbi:hypothetical protein BC936DRAFT_147583 [Jimgerdemannia flammicorona]|uniref:Uncharacterized protein n=2 Tax=Jimgerdemannia flammicorona TaxID=994334 RepID=A0A433DNR2_9FUNG|nr:hypothetical protein BC936DRAFT_147583 [Jimgerdemannia flammicorona]RUS29762.1 hypothetical protein BC938DRAFT_480282 [Jimgerdemannia flammicorona]